MNTNWPISHLLFQLNMVHYETSNIYVILLLSHVIVYRCATKT